MAFVYVLESLSTGKFYIGSTLDLVRRLEQHLQHRDSYTGSRGPWKLVYQEQFADFADARERERQLKSWKSHRAIVDLILAGDSCS
jgi:putative endonuclease